MSDVAGTSGCNLVEIFSSVQGEGVYVGAPTLFVRFGGCDLRCRWCDSPHTWEPASECRVQTARDDESFRAQRNPVAFDDVVSAAEALDVADHEFVSLTGGEPLLQPEAVRAVARELRARGPRTHLETHGIAVGGLEVAIDAIDVVSMDWKLSSDVRRASDPRGGHSEPFHAAHAQFLKVARRAPEVVVKVVITPHSRDDEIDEMIAVLRATAPDVALVLQPVTPFGPVREAPSAQRLLSLCARLSGEIAVVRVIPQTHKIYGAP